MKKIVRLTENDLARIVKRVMENHEYRGKFRDQDEWIDSNDRTMPHSRGYDRDMADLGFYDDEPEWEGFEEIGIENFEDLPDDLPRTWGIGKHDPQGKTRFDLYKKNYGDFRLLKRKK